MTPSWYDVLGVEPTASTEEIRAAWRASVADLDPTDRRFKQRNRAAEVLLDADARRAHDATLAEEAAEEAAEEQAVQDPAGEPQVADTAVAQSGASASSTGRAPEPVSAATTATTSVETPASTRAGRYGGHGIVRAVWALAALAVVLVVVTVIAAVNVGGQDSSPVADAAAGDPSATGGLPDELQVQDAVDAAKAAIVPVLSYDYHHLAHDEKTAQGFMTPAYASTYASYFSNAVLTNAPRTQTVVTVQVLDAGVVRTGPGRVDVLLFVNRPTTNKNGTSIYHDQVTARMVDTDGRWLVDCLITEQNGTCGS